MRKKIWMNGYIGYITPLENGTFLAETMSGKKEVFNDQFWAVKWLTWERA